MLGEPVAVTDHAMIADALAETLTALAGHVCDRFERDHRHLEVSAPLAGPPVRGDLVQVLGYRAPHGVFRLTIIVRGDDDATAWDDGGVFARGTRGA
jgi:hypothetical protein